jgi:hypothetical protein
LQWCSAQCGVQCSDGRLVFLLSWLLDWSWMVWCGWLAPGAVGSGG